MNLNNFYKVLEQLWNAETLPTDVVVHLCFMVVSSFAFFFFMLLAAVISKEYVHVTDVAMNSIHVGFMWSNIFLNLLFMLIIAEITQMVISWYNNYTRDNL